MLRFTANRFVANRKNMANHKFMANRFVAQNLLIKLAQ